MNADKHGSDTDEITEKIIGCAFRVSNALGSGFLEKVYENALAHEMRKAGPKVFQQYPLKVRYDGVVVGEYFVDLSVEDAVVVELKHVRAIDDAELHSVSTTCGQLAFVSACC